MFFQEVEIVVEPDIPDFLNFSESEEDDDDESEQSDSIKSEASEEPVIKTEKFDEKFIKNEFNGKNDEIIKESPLKRIKLEKELSAESYLKSNVNITIRRITKPIKQEFQQPNVVKTGAPKPNFVLKQKPQPNSVVVKQEPQSVVFVTKDHRQVCVKQEQQSTAKPPEFVLKILQERKMLSLEQIEILRNISNSNVNLMRTPLVPEFKKFAMTLYNFSSVVYEHVRIFFNPSLPAPHLLVAGFKKSSGNPGFCREAFNTLTNLSKISKNGKNDKNLLFSMVVGEMKLKPGIQFDEKGKVYGWTDLGWNTVDGSCDLAENVFFIILTGVNNDFRIPIGYFLIGKMTGEQIASLIRMSVELTTETNVRIVSLSFEQNSAYHSLTTSLGCEFNVSQFNKLRTFFIVRSVRIYVFPEIYGIFDLIEKCLKEQKVIYYRTNVISCELDENDESQESFHTRKFWLNLKKIKEFFEIENFADKLKAQKSRKEIYDFLQSMIKYFSRLKLSPNENDLIVKSKYKKGFIGMIVSLKSLFQIGLDFVRNRINAKNFPNFRLGQQHLNLFMNNFQSNSTAYEFVTEYKKNKFPSENKSIFYNLINSSIKNINTTTKRPSAAKIKLKKKNVIKKTSKLDKSYNIDYLSTIVAAKLIKEINCETCHRFLIEENVKNSEFPLKTIENEFFYPTMNLLKICELTNKFLNESDLTHRLLIVKNVLSTIFELNVYKNMCCHALTRFGLFDHDLLLIRTIVEVYLEVRCDILEEDSVD